MSALDLPAAPPPLAPSAIPPSLRLLAAPRLLSFREHTKTLAPTVHFLGITLPPAEPVIFSRRPAFVCGNVGARLQRGELQNVHYSGEKRPDSGGGGHKERLAEG